MAYGLRKLLAKLEHKSAPQKETGSSWSEACRQRRLGITCIIGRGCAP